MSTTLPEPATTPADHPQLPQGWVWTTIGEVTETVTKIDPTENPQKEFVYLDISSIDNFTFQVVEPKTYLGRDAPSRARQLVRTSDVLFSTVRTYLKNIALVPESCDGQVASTGFAILRGKLVVLNKYLFYFCLTDDFLNAMAELQRGTSYPAVRDSDVREHPIPLPPLAEQQRIVAAIETQLTRLDAGVASLKAARAKLRRYRASVLKAACEGRLVGQDPSDEPASALLQRILAERRERRAADLRARGKDPAKVRYEEPVAPDAAGLPALPAGWVWTKVGQILGEPLSNGRSVPDADQGFPVLRLTALKGEKLDLRERKIGAWTHEEAMPFLVHLGDFFVARGNGSIKLVGKGAELRDEPDEVAFPDTLIRVRPEPALCLTTYFAHVWSSKLMRSQIETTARTTAGIYKISQQDIQSFVIPLPPLAEQRRIVAEVERRLSVVAALETAVAANLRRAERLRQAILKRAFAGRLVAQDPSDEPASVLLERVRETGRQGGKETRRRGDRETGRQGDQETGRQGDQETGR